MSEGTESAAPAVASGGEGGKKAAGAGKLVIPLLAVNSLLMVGVLALVLLRGGHAPAPAAPQDGAHPEGGHGEPAGAGEGHGEAGGGGHGEGGGAHARAGALPLPGPTLKLPDFVIHLRDADADRYARMSFEVEVGSEDDKGRVTAYLPQIRDVFIAYLTNLTVEDLRGGDALMKMKQALSERLVATARGTDVKALYITDFVVQ
jgi:flagellar FliL protein